MENSHVPKFGSWESEEVPPYTSYFDNAKKGKKGDQTDSHEIKLRPSREEVEPRRSTSSPMATSRHNRRVSREEGDMKRITSQENSNSNSPRHHLGNGGTPRRVDHSPLAPSTPARSRLKSVTRGDDSPDGGPAVPKFGDWDETDPAAAEGYTHIFNRVRQEKNTETGKVPVMPTAESATYSNGNHHNNNAKGCGCFPWGKR